MKELKLKGMITVMDREVANVEGGFGEGKKSMLAKDIAEFHKKKLKKVNEAINNNIDKFRFEVDLIDLKQVDEMDLFLENLKSDGVLSQAQIGNANNIYLLSERGYAKLIKIFNDDLSWKLYDKLLDEYFDMRKELKETPASYMIENPIERAKAWIKEQEDKQLLVEENVKKDQMIGELKPKADYTDTILQNDSLLSVTQIAQDYGTTAYQMNRLLHDLGVQYKQGSQWCLYRKHNGKSYTHSETYEYEVGNGIKGVNLTTKWTQKGRLFLYNLLKDNNVLPEIEK